jgi:small subunit ribosomal protein S21
MTSIKVRIGDPIEKAIRALKKRLDKEGVMKSVKAHRFYLKPSIKKRAKSKAAQKYRRGR